MENVLNTTPETREALEQHGIDTIPDLLNEPFNILDNLEYRPMVTGTDGNPTPARFKKQVARGSIRQLMIFMDYCSYRFAQSDPISDWTTVTHDQYNNFRLSHDYMLAKKIPGKTRFTKDPNPLVIDDFFQSAQPTVATPNSPAARSPPPVPQPNYRTPNLQDQFMKGIKRDPSLFPTLKDEKFHDSWHRSFENQMHAQGLHQVIDPNYNPTTPDEQAVFGLMQTFMYAVLEAKVFTTKGKEIVRQFELTRDARGTYKALLKHHRSSTASTIAARDIMAFLTTSTVGDGRVKGTTSDFISYWCDQARLYQQLLGSQSSFSDDEKMIHLVRAVATIPELRSIKATADMLAMTTGVKVSFPQYYQLLVSAAAQYDSTTKTAPKRLVYQHDIHDNDNDDHI